MKADTENLERELKFAVDVGFKLPNLAKVAGSTIRLPQQTLNTAYFDTPDLRLWQRGITLRHREGEDRLSGRWTLKLPEDGEDRSLDRLELSWHGMREEVPAEVSRILQGVVRRSMLGRIVVLESLRRRVVLRDDKGSELGEIDDDLVTVAHGTKRGLSFRQVEFEYGSDLDPLDHDDLVDAILKKLRKAGARPETEQKFAKALGPGTAPPQKWKGKVGHKASLQEVVRLAITDGLERALDEDYGLRIDPADPPVRAVHQARVAFRRLRSDLKTYGPLLDPVWLEHATTELRWIGTRLGQVRDVDVLTDRLGVGGEATTAQPQPKPNSTGGSGTGSSGNTGGSSDAAGSSNPTAGSDGSEHLRARLVAQRDKYCAELSEAMTSDRYLELLDRLHSAALAPPFALAKRRSPGMDRRVRSDDLARDVLPSLVTLPWKNLRRRVRRAGRKPTDHQLHRIRIAAKQLRYASEAAAPVMGKPALRTASGAEALQTILGEHHDAVAAEGWLRLAARHGSGMEGFAAGLRVAHERHLQRELRHEWRSVWSSLSAKKNTRWLRRG